MEVFRKENGYEIRPGADLRDANLKDAYLKGTILEGLKLRKSTDMNTIY